MEAQTAEHRDRLPAQCPSTFLDCTVREQKEWSFYTSLGDYAARINAYVHVCVFACLHNISMYMHIHPHDITPL